MISVSEATGGDATLKKIQSYSDNIVLYFSFEFPVGNGEAEMVLSPTEDFFTIDRYSYEGD